jgi:hypothetical protein
MTGHTEEDLIWPTLIVAGIANRLNEKQEFFVKEIPSFAPRYPNIKFNDSIPRILRKHRRSIHQDVLSDDNNVYLNVWLRHLRGNFVQDGNKKAALQIAKAHMTNLGYRRRITFDNMLGTPRKECSFTLSHATDGEYFVCLTRSCIDKLDTADLSTVMSSVSLATFSANTHVTHIRSPNFKPCSNDEFVARLRQADLIVTTKLFTLLPFFNDVSDKKIILLDGSSDDCDDLFSNHTALGEQNLIRLIRSFME